MRKTVIITALALCFSLVNVNAKTSNYSTNNNSTVAFFKVSPFCVSIAKGDIETVRTLLSRGAEVNEKSNGMTPVMYAAKFNRTEILELLIVYGADLKAKSDKGLTALNYAELHKAEDAYKILDEALNKKDK